MEQVCNLLAPPESQTPADYKSAPQVLFNRQLTLRRLLAQFRQFPALFGQAVFQFADPLAHTQPDLVDLVIANDRFDDVGAPWPIDGVEPRWPPNVDPPPHLVTDGVASADDPHHHDPGRLAVAILRAIEREGPAVRRERTARLARIA